MRYGRSQTGDDPLRRPSATSKRRPKPGGDSSPFCLQGFPSGLKLGAGGPKKFGSCIENVSESVQEPLEQYPLVVQPFYSFTTLHPKVPYSSYSLVPAGNGILHNGHRRQAGDLLFIEGPILSGTFKGVPLRGIYLPRAGS